MHGLRLCVQQLLYCALRIGCHKETDSVHLEVYQINQLSLGGNIILLHNAVV